MEVVYSKYMYGHKWGYMGGSLALVIFASDSASYLKPLIGQKTLQEHHRNTTTKTLYTIVPAPLGNEPNDLLYHQYQIIHPKYLSARDLGLELMPRLARELANSMRTLNIESVTIVTVAVTSIELGRRDTLTVSKHMAPWPANPSSSSPQPSPRKPSPRSSPI